MDKIPTDSCRIGTLEIRNSAQRPYLGGAIQSPYTLGTCSAAFVLHTSTHPIASNQLHELSVAVRKSE